MNSINREMNIVILVFLLVAIGCKSINEDKNEKSNDPNIIIIYLDDLGYGDVSSYGATEFSTPNIDALSNGGIRFTNAYASSATCTPSRYALLTGKYPWRNSSAKILPGTAPLIIDTDQMTIPKLLSKKGYHTGIVGKWHLGLGRGNVDWNQRVSPGPNEVGFDYSYIMAATQDRVPTVYLEDGHVLGLDPNDPIQINYKKNFEGEPNGKDNLELLTMKWHHGHNSSIINGIPRIGYMKGGDKAKWSDVDMADAFLGKAKEYISAHKKEPFFLYYAMQQPHVPRTPHPRFIGKSGLGPRGDVIIEADWCIGELISTLEEQGVLENTLIILSSDNGPVLNDGYYDDAVEKLGNHKPAGNLRGGKYSLYEAGTRVPFITYWKGTIEPGTSAELVCQMDLLQSLASMMGEELEDTDSQDLINVLIGKKGKGRESLVVEATSRTAFKKGDWILIPPYKGKVINELVDIELGNSDDFQLFNVKEDGSQQHNLAQDKPEVLKAMLLEFEKIRGKDYGNTKKLELK